jgi:hypothetical protein
MSFQRIVRSLALTAGLVLALTATACNKEPTRWDQAASQKPPSAAPGAAELKAGGAFNAFFPADGVDGYKRVFTQEKQGFAECKLQKDGKDVATLSINDLAADDEAKKKFASSTDKVDGSPLVTVGKNQSAVLVKDRYQAKVSSQTLDADARKQLFSKFNLAGLGGL